MKWLLTGLGVLLVALGALWALQGADLVHVKPVACVADCAELQGPSPTWLIAGLATLAVGAGLIVLARRRKRH